MRAWRSIRSDGHVAGVSGHVAGGAGSVGAGHAMMSAAAACCKSSSRKKKSRRCAIAQKSVTLAKLPKGVGRFGNVKCGINLPYAYYISFSTCKVKQTINLFLYINFL
jgi:hypothetical protein